MNTVILYKERIAGVAGFNEIKWSNKTADIGYWLGEEFQGNGIMTKVAKTLTDYAFSELILKLIPLYSFGVLDLISTLLFCVF
jgi:ribosomal-protein-serine acetyltransferase